MGIVVENVTRTYKGMTYLEDISLEIDDGSFMTFLGATESGKTTLMRLIAGIDQPNKGRIYYNGKDVTDLPVQKRRVAMVYQDFINYPSMTVFENIASPLRIAKKKYTEEDIQERVMKNAQLLGIDGVLDHHPEEVSGGQQQRTAIARALTKEADYIFLDEPLQNLDYKLREELRGELKTIFRKREGAIVYATPEPTDALSMATHVGFLHEGRLLAFGPVQEVYNNPPNLEVGTYFSYPSMNVFDGTPKSENGKLLLRVSDELKVDVSHLADKLKDESCFLGIRAHDVHTTKPEGSNIEIKAQVDLLEVVGSDVELHLTHQGISFISLMSEFAGLFEIRMGDTIPVYLDPSCFFIFSKKDHKLVAKTS